jgi:hypothetical protein
MCLSYSQDDDSMTMCLSNSQDDDSMTMCLSYSQEDDSMTMCLSYSQDDVSVELTGWIMRLSYSQDDDSMTMCLSYSPDEESRKTERTVPSLQLPTAFSERFMRSPNEDFGRPNQPFRMRFRCTFQWREYCFGATNC